MLKRSRIPYSPCYLTRSIEVQQHSPSSWKSHTPLGPVPGLFDGESGEDKDVVDEDKKDEERGQPTRKQRTFAHIDKCSLCFQYVCMFSQDAQKSEVPFEGGTIVHQFVDPKESTDSDKATRFVVLVDLQNACTIDRQTAEYLFFL